MHIHTPCFYDNEIICCGCAQVLDPQPYEDDNLQHRSFGNGDGSTFYIDDVIFMGLEKLFLPLSVASGSVIGNKKIGFWRDNFDHNLLNEKRVFDRLLWIVEEQLHIPKYYAFETMRRLFKKNRGMYSHKLQLEELIDVLQTTNDKRLRVHIIKVEDMLKNAKGI